MRLEVQPELVEFIAQFLHKSAGIHASSDTHHNPSSVFTNTNDIYIEESVICNAGILIQCDRKLRSTGYSFPQFELDFIYNSIVLLVHHLHHGCM